MTTELTSETHNGVNVQALLDARKALESAPEAAQFTWRADSKWLNGVHCQTKISGFFGLGEEKTRNTTHIVETDHPAEFAAPDDAATPVEVLLSGLAGCLTAGVAAVAENRGIKLRSINARLEGDMDIAGILGIDANIRNGFSAIRVQFDIDADASADDIAALVAQSQKRSAVFDILTNPTSVHVSVAGQD